jgi:hypothetical protein
MRLRLQRCFTFIVSALLVPVAMWPHAASAATSTTISDQASCQAIVAGAKWDTTTGQCSLPNYTVPPGSALTISGVFVATAGVLNVSNRATLTISNNARLRNYGGVLSNAGTINVNSGELGILQPATNTGQINVRSDLWVTETLTNNQWIGVWRSCRRQRDGHWQRASTICRLQFAGGQPYADERACNADRGTDAHVDTDPDFDDRRGTSGSGRRTHGRPGQSSHLSG